MIIGTVQQKISSMQTKITTSERSSNDFNSAHNGQRYYFMHSEIRCPALKTLSFLATKIFLAATILQKEVAKRRLLENLSLKHCKSLRRNKPLILGKVLKITAVLIYH